MKTAVADLLSVLSPYVPHLDTHLVIRPVIQLQLVVGVSRLQLDYFVAANYLE